MPILFQYQAESSPILGNPPPPPKLGWLARYVDIVPTVQLITAACLSTQGTARYTEFPIQPNTSPVGSPHPLGRVVRFQYTSEVGPLYIADRAPKHSWNPTYADIVPTAATLPIACNASSGMEGHPEFKPMLPVPLRSWAPDFPDIVPGPKPIPIHPSWMFGLPFNVLPLSPAFLTWEPDYQSIVPGPRPLPVDAYSNFEVITFYDATATGDQYTTWVLINGINRASYIEMATITVDDYLNEQPNTARFTILPGAPFTINGGETIIIGVGGPEIANRRFLGKIITVSQVYLGGLRSNVAFHITCQDGTYNLKKRYPVRRYTSQSATSVIIDLINSFSSGFTTSNVVAGLPNISIDLDGSDDLATCLTNIANLIGGYWYPDNINDVHFYLTESTNPPLPINEANADTEDGAHNIVFDKDLSQIRTRVIVTGATSSVDLGVTVATIPAGSTTIPLSTQAPFSSGTIKIGPQTISYTGVSADAGKGSIVAGVPLNPPSIGGAIAISVPTVNASGQLVGPAGSISAGLYRYVVAFVNDKNEESEPSTGVISAAINTVAAPNSISATASSQLSGNIQSNGGTAYFYSLSFRTSNGETLPSSRSIGSIPLVLSPTGSTFATASTDPGNILPGSYLYYVSYKTSNGETQATQSGSVTINPITSIGFFTSSQILTTAGGGLAGTYNYSLTAIDAVGETVPLSQTGNMFLSGGASNNSVSLSVSAASDARIRARRIYRNGGTIAGSHLIAEITGLAAFTVTDSATDASILNKQTAPTGPNTTGTGKILLQSIPVTPDQRVIGRNIYRTKANAFSAPAFLVATINDNITTTFTDNTADANLPGTTRPLSSTADNGQMQITNLQVSSDPRVISRELYRTSANGAITGKVASLTNLVTVNPLTGQTTQPTTFFIDNVADSSLGAPPLTVATADNGMILLSSIPVGPTFTTTRRVYRTIGGGIAFKLAFTIQDNTTSTYLDNNSNDSLGNPPNVASEWRTRVGSTTLPVPDLSIFTEIPGWIKVGSMVLEYFGKSAASGAGFLTGFPATGLGSIVSDITAKTTILCIPFLKGVSGIIYPINHGDTMAIRAVVDNVAAQQLLAAMEGGDGIHEFPINDPSLLNLAECTSRGLAELALFALQLKAITFTARDFNLRSGKDVVFTLGSPSNITLTAKIQHVQITEFTMFSRKLPLNTVAASITKFSLQDVLRRLALT